MAIETECLDKQEKHTDLYGHLIMKVNFRDNSSKSEVKVKGKVTPKQAYVALRGPGG
jgi:hypothetical protein